LPGWSRLWSGAGFTATAEGRSLIASAVLLAAGSLGLALAPTCRPSSPQWLLIGLGMSAGL